MGTKFEPTVPYAVPAVKTAVIYSFCHIVAYATIIRKSTILPGLLYQKRFPIIISIRETRRRFHLLFGGLCDEQSGSARPQDDREYRKRFFELLGSKPIEKITVAELARAARINKGTFYRHYLDIPDLYMKIMQKTLSKPIAEADFFPSIFDDPERFMEGMSKLVIDNLGKVKRLLQNQNRYIPLDPLLDMFRERIYGLGLADRSVKNDIRLDMVFGSILICVPNYDGRREEVNAVTAAMIRSLFSDGAVNN